MCKRIFDFDLPVIEALFRQYVSHASFIWKHICWLIIKSFGVKTLTLRTKQGKFKVSTKDNAIGRSLFTKGQFEYDFSIKALDLLQAHQFVGPENITLFDVGANIGIISVGLLLKGQVAQSVAIEPEKTNFRFLINNINLNCLDSKTLCLPYALGDRNAVLKMEISPDNLGDHRIQGSDALTQVKHVSEESRALEQVKVLPLDDLIRLPEIAERKWTLGNAVLWIDVQGYEGHVFQGAKAFLAKGVPTVSEIWPYGILRSGMSLDEFCRIVQSNWSDYWVLRGERFIRYPISMFDRYLDEIEDGDGNVVFTRAV